jgi:hypothetical protein
MVLFPLGQQGSKFSPGFINVASHRLQEGGESPRILGALSLFH